MRRAIVWISIAAGVACAPTEPPAPARPFVDVAAEAGLDFTHENGMTGEFYLPEIVGSGLAWLDYDNDGDLDLYVVQGAPLDASLGRSGDDLPSDRLFRNDLATGEDGRTTVRFTDVSAEVGLPRGGYGMGVAVGDYDNDGWEDVYVTQLGPNRLLRNEGGRRFVDVTEASGTGDPWWSVSATFVDYDRDGLLDLYVADYLDWTFASNQECYRTNGLEDYCGPASYLPVPDRLFRNEGNGRFADVTAPAGIAASYGAGLGVVAADFDNDGWPDLYVANDGLPNQLWMNLGDGRFRDEALLAGCAVNADGKAEASMGIDAADFDGDGDEDLFMSHLNEETNTLYVNGGAGDFADRSAPTGVGPASEPYTGFGAGWFDYDNDGLLDVYVVNGAVHTLEDLARQGDPYPLRQPNQLFHNEGGSYREVPGGLGEQVEVSRGSALGDYDNDGDVDIAISNSAGPLRLLRNETGNANAWIGLRVRGGEAFPRYMIGAWVTVETGSGKRIYRRVRRDGSYASSNDPRVLIGLDGETSVRAVEVRWPDGAVTRREGLEIDRWHTLVP